MTLRVAPSKPITDAYLVALKTLGREVGDAAKPPSPANPPSSFYPYFVLYTGISRLQGSAEQSKEDGLHRLQVTTVGKTRAGVDDYRHQARTILLDIDTSIDGHAVVWTELIAAQPVARDDDVKPPLFFAVDVVNALITPVP